MLGMTTRKKSEGDPPKGRQAFKYVGLPSDLYQEVKDFADLDDRTVPGIVKRAVREYLSNHKPAEDEPEGSK